MTYFSRWLAEHGRPVTSASLTRPVLVEYLAHSADTVAPGTALTRFKHLRAFCSFLAAEADLPTSPMVGLKPPEVPERPVLVLTDDDLKALIKAAASQRRPFNARRDEAMVRMLNDAGVRISELVSMQREELDLDGGAVWVLGKGGRRRDSSCSAPGKHVPVTVTSGSEARTGSRPYQRYGSLNAAR